ncbi:aminoacylase-1, putative [Phytophthora infestans T30-4]|uniref:N-acyl-aliphatic-L-amino acid amidohydrolase n=1 Tax=Phytophthora infestans (strain T30-4) TaxID=403677 RepID=D0MSP3_PHYIT|nr:aminoacylase-1, putative [Phytophthora infestans T30-4]EEY57477.1 aminoacylase-1, putative [Phytophthora infestans T30-4]|eukprot:XP_002908663.1 aminoacylase-1, putative [Phytophthora infestans T30-4]
MATPTSSVERLLQYIRIPTISGDGPKGAYNEVLQVFSPSESKPIATWQGKDSSLPSILLNSHYDVVPVAREHWQHDPFKPTVLEDGMIYGRGIQDMKSVGVQYVEAVSRLKAEGFIPSRNIHLLFVPDEEIGGVDGMEAFLASEQYKSIQPVAFAFDEGLANPNDVFTVFYGERVPWWFYVKAEGPTGHGSRFIKNTATSKIIDVCNKALAFRAEQEALLSADSGCKHGDIKKRNLGDVTTVNLNMLQSGVSQDGGKTHALNVIPTEAVAGFDVRISPHMDLKKLKAMLDEWCSAEGLSWEFVSWWKNPLHEHYTTSVDDTNIWWTFFKEGCKDVGVPVETEVFPAATDSRFLRQLGIPALGFSPMNKTEILLHEHNECLHKDTFLRGIDVYETLFRRMFTYAEAN